MDVRGYTILDLDGPFRSQVIPINAEQLRFSNLGRISSIVGRLFVFFKMYRYCPSYLPGIPKWNPDPKLSLRLTIDTLYYATYGLTHAPSFWRPIWFLKPSFIINIGSQTPRGSYRYVRIYNVNDISRELFNEFNSGYSSRCVRITVNTH